MRQKKSALSRATGREPAKATPVKAKPVVSGLGNRVKPALATKTKPGAVKSAAAKSSPIAKKSLRPGAERVYRVATEAPQATKQAGKTSASVATVSAKPTGKPTGKLAVRQAVKQAVKKSAKPRGRLIRSAKFSVGQVVRHRVYPFRGIVFDIDPVFANTDEWLNAIPANVRPRRNQPFYHLLAESAETEYIAYVSEQNLLADDSGLPVRHPQISEYFSENDDGTLRSLLLQAH